MAYGTKQEKREEPAGAPEWMVTFSDCMTLLLTFFVLLLSFSSFDKNIFRTLKVIFNKQWPSVGSEQRKDKRAFLAAYQIEPTDDLDGGSEKPTLEKGMEDNLKRETEPADFRRRKVFMIPSSRIFWGRGTVMSAEGRRILATMAALLKEVPNRIVISESGADQDRADTKFGLARSWTVMEHLATQQGLEKKRFSLSAASIMAHENPEENEETGTGAEAERLLEIVLLERSICN